MDNHQLYRVVSHFGGDASLCFSKAAPVHLLGYSSGSKMRFLEWLLGCAWIGRFRVALRYSCANAEKVPSTMHFMGYSLLGSMLICRGNNALRSPGCVVRLRIPFLFSFILNGIQQEHKHTFGGSHEPIPGPVLSPDSASGCCPSVQRLAGPRTWRAIRICGQRAKTIRMGWGTQRYVVMF